MTAMDATPPSSGSVDVLDQPGALRAFLAPFAGRRVCRPSLSTSTGDLVGNHGDHLITMGTDKLLADLGVIDCPTPSDADLILIDGSGSMMERARWVPSILRDACHQLPDTPVCVLPSSFHFPTKPIAPLIGERSAPVTLFCRERRSLEHLQRDHALPACCRLGLAPDMAFELQDTPWLHGLQAMTPKHTLIVERIDIEHPTVAFDQQRVPMRSLRRMLPRWTKDLLRPLVRQARTHQRSPFRRRCEALLGEHHPQAAKGRQLFVDISNPGYGDFDSFARTIAESAVIFTTRLHVGILGSMIGRDTYLFTGPYHKIQGVYEYSLAGMDHVRLIES